MSQTSSEKFLYFTVGLLKGSDALEALRQDATRYHMIDHPGQLIALRLTEYYEMIDQGIIQPGIRVPGIKTSPEAETTTSHEQIAPTETHVSQRPVPVSFPSPVAPITNVQSQPVPAGQAHRPYSDTHAPSTDHSESTNALNQLTGKMRAMRRESESVVSVSSAADQNADEAADYWSTL
jgi:hypothetical protein